MSPAMQSVLDDWSLPIWLTLTIALTGLIYLRGWIAIRRTRPGQFSGWRLLSFFSGLISLWVAIGSPLDAFADVLLSAHMVEHLVLMSVVPPLLLLGLPVVPMLRGIPVIVQKAIISPLLRLGQLRSLVHWITSPRVAWIAMNLAFLGWHVPAAYDFALDHEGWHDVEHICFLMTSLLFWWCVLRPWPAVKIRQRWSILLYLVGADLVNTALSGFLSFCNRIVYPYYVLHPNPFQIDPLSDQVLGAVIMWVFGSVAFLLPAVWITGAMLQSNKLTNPDKATT